MEKSQLQAIANAILNGEEVKLRYDFEELYEYMVTIGKIKALENYINKRLQ